MIDDAEILQVGAERAERLADREVDVAVGQGRDGQRAALGGQHLDLEAMLGRRCPPVMPPQSAAVSAMGSAATRTLRRLARGLAGGVGRVGVGASTQGDRGDGDQPESKTFFIDEALPGRGWWGASEAGEMPRICGGTNRCVGAHAAVLAMVSHPGIESQEFLTPVMNELNDAVSWWRRSRRHPGGRGCRAAATLVAALAPGQVRGGQTSGRPT